MHPIFTPLLLCFICAPHFCAYPSTHSILAPSLHPCVHPCIPPLHPHTPYLHVCLQPRILFLSLCTPRLHTRLHPCTPPLHPCIHTPHFSHFCASLCASTSSSPCTCPCTCFHLLAHILAPHPCTHFHLLAPILAPIFISLHPILAPVFTSLHASLPPILSPMCAPHDHCPVHPIFPHPAPFPIHPSCSHPPRTCQVVSRLVPATERYNCVISYKRDTHVSRFFFFFFPLFLRAC